MRLSTITGTIIREEPISIFKIVDKEKFYEVRILINNCNIPAVCSEFLLKDIKEKASMRGYLACEYMPTATKRKLYTFFQVLDASPVTSEIADVNIIELKFEIMKLNPFSVDKISGKVRMGLIGRYYTGDKKTAIIHMLSMESTARKLRNAKPGDKVVASGYIHSRGEPIEIVITDIERIQRKEELK